MNCLKKTICAFLAIWTPIAFAYTNLANSRGEVLPSPGQGEAMAAVLIDENREARCKIAGEHGEFLSSDRFGDFTLANPQTERALDEINALPECDERDALYAGVVLDSEEVAIAGIPSPNKALHAMGFGVAGIDFVYLCFIDRPHHSSFLFMVLSGLEGWFGADIAWRSSVGFLPGLAALILGKFIGAWQLPIPVVPLMLPKRVNKGLKGL